MKRTARIIAGEFGGRELKTPRSRATHPMSERVRGALFSKLGDISGLIVLDAYAGSGALGIEALSRGAKFVYFVDSSRESTDVINRNLAALKIAPPRYKVTRARLSSWSRRQTEQRFDLILADPPYDAYDYAGLSALPRHLKNNGLMVISYPGRESTPTVNGVVVVDNLSYGDAALAFYRQDV